MYLCLIHVIIGIKYKQKDVFKISTIVVFSLTKIMILQKQPVLMYNYTCNIMVMVQQLVLQKWFKFNPFKSFSQVVWYLPLHVFEKKGGMGGVTPLP